MNTLQTRYLSQSLAWFGALQLALYAYGAFLHWPLGKWLLWYAAISFILLEALAYWLTRRARSESSQGK